MGKSAIRLLALSVCAALVAISVFTPANAAAGGGVEIEKSRKRIQKGSSANDPRSGGPAWPPPMYDDFDRKNAGGAGGM